MTARRIKLTLKTLLGPTIVLLILFAALVWVPFNHYMVNFVEIPKSKFLGIPPLEKAVISNLKAVPSYYTRLLSDKPVINKLHIEIKPKDYKKLTNKRAQALDVGALFQEDDDYVPATLRYGGKLLRAKLRLKGDLLDHLHGRRWSFRVQVKGGEALLGLRRFSLQAPYTRGYQSEAFFFDFMREQGVVTPRSMFVELWVNDERVGVTNLEESFAKELLQGQQRRESVILKFDEDNFWLATKQGLTTRVWVDTFGWRTGDLRVFQSNKVQGSPKLSAYHDMAMGLIRGVVSGTIAPSEVFDVDLLGRWLAGCEVFYTPHMMFWHNLRWYFNPLTARLEPITFDSNMKFFVPVKKNLACVGGLKNMTQVLVEDSAIRAAYLRHLQAMIVHVNTPDFAEFLDQRQSYYLSQLQVDYPWVPKISLALIRDRAKKLAFITAENFSEHIPKVSALMDKKNTNIHAEFPAFVQAFVREDDKGYYLEIINSVNVPLSINELTFDAMRDQQNQPFHTLIKESLPIQIAGGASDIVPNRVKLYFDKPTSVSAQAQVSGKFTVMDRSQSYEFLSEYTVLPATSNPIPSVTVAQALAKHEFLSVGEDDLSLKVKAGIWQLSDWLIVPDGYGLIIEPGTQLQFANNVGLISRGPLLFQGTQMQTIELTGIDGATWLGLISLESTTKHQWSHVKIKNTHGVALGQWRVSAGVTLRRCQIEMNHVTIDTSEAEDALNLVHCQFSFRHVNISNTVSDGFDVDFSEGTVEQGIYRDIGGDALDASGSNISLNAVQISDVKGRALLVDKHSQLSAKALQISRSEIGVVSRGDSTASLENSSLEDIGQAAFMSYSSKKEYDSASLRAVGNTLNRVGRVAIAQTGSSLSIDGDIVRTEELDMQKYD